MKVVISENRFCFPFQDTTEVKPSEYDFGKHRRIHGSNRKESCDKLNYHECRSAENLKAENSGNPKDWDACIRDYIYSHGNHTTQQGDSLYGISMNWNYQDAVRNTENPNTPESSNNGDVLDYLETGHIGNGLRPRYIQTSESLTSEKMGKYTDYDNSTLGNLITTIDDNLVMYVKPDNKRKQKHKYSLNQPGQKQIRKKKKKRKAVKPKNTCKKTYCERGHQTLEKGL